MLSIPLQLVSGCSAYVYDLRDFDVFFCKRMLSIRIYFCRQMLSIPLKLVSVCLVYVYKLYAYFQLTSIFENIEWRGNKWEFD